MKSKILGIALLMFMLVPISSSTVSATAIFDSPPTSWPAGDMPRSIAVGDIDGDDWADVVVTNVDADEYTVLLNAGDGTFPVSISQSSYDEEPRDVVLAEIDATPGIDMVIACTGDLDGGWTQVFRNTGWGFERYFSYSSGEGPWRVIAAEFDNVPGNDIAVLYPWSGSISVAHNDGYGKFVKISNYGVTVHPEEFSAADFNADGHLDLVFTNSYEGGYSLAVMQNDSNGAFAMVENILLPQIPKGLTAGFFNEDEYADVAVGYFSPIGPADIQIFFGSDSGLQAPVNYSGFPDIINMISADLNFDGFPDIALVSLVQSYLAVLYNDGSGGFDDFEMHATNLGPYDLAAIDVTGDHAVDIITANAYSDDIQVFTSSLTTSTSELPGAVTGITGSYPNPFNPKTAVSFRLEEAQMIDLSVFSTTGRKIASLLSGEHMSGPHTAQWNGVDSHGNSVAGGLYLARLTTSKGVDTHKLMLIK